jgi:hypothetical protein
MLTVCIGRFCLGSLVCVDVRIFGRRYSLEAGDSIKAAVAGCFALLELKVASQNASDEVENPGLHDTGANVFGATNADVHETLKSERVRLQERL